MPEILERGQNPEEKEYLVTCGHCKSRLLYKKFEGKPSYDQRDGDFITFICPVCGNPIYVDL